MITFCVSHYSLKDNGLTGTGAIVLAKALQQNKSLEELKWVVDSLDRTHCKHCSVGQVLASYPGWRKNVMVGCWNCSLHKVRSTYQALHSTNLVYSSGAVTRKLVFTIVDSYFYKSGVWWIPVDWLWRWGSNCTGWSKSNKELPNTGVSDFWFPHDFQVNACTNYVWWCIAVERGLYKFATRHTSSGVWGIRVENFQTAFHIPLNSPEK